MMQKELSRYLLPVFRKKYKTDLHLKKYPPWTPTYFGLNEPRMILFKPLKFDLWIFQENKLAAKKIKLLTDRIKAEKDAEKKRFAGKLFG